MRRPFGVLLAGSVGLVVALAAPAAATHLPTHQCPDDAVKNVGMRIDHLLVTAPVADRLVEAEIDREARKGKPVSSDHAPLLVDIDEPGAPLDGGWAAADGRIAARRAR